MPGIFGSIAGVVMAGLATTSRYGTDAVYEIFMTLLISIL